MRIALVLIMLCSIAHADHVEGWVANDQGTRIAGAPVRIIVRQVVYVTRTDARGRYSIDGVPKGGYRAETDGELVAAIWHPPEAIDLHHLGVLIDASAPPDPHWSTTMTGIIIVDGQYSFF